MLKALNTCCDAAPMGIKWKQKVIIKDLRSATTAKDSVCIVSIFTLRIIKNSWVRGAAPLASGLRPGRTSTLGAATVRCHNVDAEYLGILSILETSQEDGTAPLTQRSRSHNVTPFLNCYIDRYRIW